MLFDRAEISLVLAAPPPATAQPPQQQPATQQILGTTRHFYNTRFLPAAESVARAVVGGIADQLPALVAPPDHPLALHQQGQLAMQAVLTPGADGAAGLQALLVQQQQVADAGAAAADQTGRQSDDDQQEARWGGGRPPRVRFDIAGDDISEGREMEVDQPVQPEEAPHPRPLQPLQPLQQGVNVDQDWRGGAVVVQTPAKPLPPSVQKPEEGAGKQQPASHKPPAPALGGLLALVPNRAPSQRLRGKRGGRGKGQGGGVSGVGESETPDASAAAGMDARWQVLGDKQQQQYVYQNDQLEPPPEQRRRTAGTSAADDKENSRVDSMPSLQQPEPQQQPSAAVAGVSPSAQGAMRRMLGFWGGASGTGGTSAAAAVGGGDSLAASGIKSGRRRLLQPPLREQKGVGDTGVFGAVAGVARRFSGRRGMGGAGGMR